MAENAGYNIFGYRFAERELDSLFYLFAVGRDRVTDPLYYWDGLKRSDGPLYLFQYTVSGLGQVDIGGQSYRLSPGDAFMVEIPGDHRYYLPSSSDHWEFYFILVRPYHLRQLWEELLQQTGPVYQLSEESGPIRLLQQIFREASLNRITDAYRASALVYPFMIELHRYGMLGSEAKEAWPAAIHAAIDYMTRHYDQPVGMDQVASEAGLSKYYFIRLFTRTTGHSPLVFLTRLRMEKAIELIHSSSLPMEQIASRIGYSSGSYFTRIFKQYVGCSPSEFKSGKATLSFSRLTFD